MIDYIQHIIDTALAEDIGAGDITTDAIVGPGQRGVGVMVAKQPFFVAGLDVAQRVFLRLDPETAFQTDYRDGDYINTGKTVMTIDGKLRTLLTGERTALNFLQRLSGIATQTRGYVQEMENLTVRLTDTRKTTPGLRILEKQAVRAGGAHNHRMGLYDAVLIKDNHIVAAGGIRNAVEKVRSRISHLTKIEVEVADFEELEAALAAGVDVIMLDNMCIEDIKKAVEIIDKKALVEVSGGVTKENLKALAETGVDVISSGALTHSAKSVDISMRIEAG